MLSRSFHLLLNGSIYAKVKPSTSSALPTGLHLLVSLVGIAF
jgi:hypothetical protein